MRRLRISPEHTREIASAVATVRGDVLARRNDRDIAYFTEHESRFAHAAARLLELVPRGSLVVDIGSHYLHQSSVMSALGYEVIGVDVLEHVELAFVRERAGKFGVDNRAHAPGAIAGGLVLSERTNHVDAILFCEILEHITFNPIRLWGRIYELLRVDGIVYITTPNGLKLLSVLGAIWNLLTLSRIGLRVEAIFAHVTYGHHWKEYGRRELHDYFARLSPDFEVAARGVAFGAPSADKRRILGPFKTFLLRLGNTTSVFAESLEAIVRLRGRTKWLAEPPEYA